MIPKTPEELRSIVYRFLISRIYGDITTAARRARLTEHDISAIERKVLDFQKETDAFAHEFDGFESEPAVARAFQEIKQLFAVTKTVRIDNIQKK